MNYFHLIYTPKGLAELDEQGLQGYDKYVCCSEVGGGGLHFHTYIETPFTRQTVSDTLKKYQNIAKVGAGKSSIHYSNRNVAEHPKDYPDQDLRKFTLGYVQKQGKQLYVKGYTPEELKEALDYYNKLSPHSPLAPYAVFASEASAGIPLDANNKIESIQDRWLAFSVAMMKGIPLVISLDEGSPLVINPNLKIEYFKGKAWNYWKKRANGLFPPQAEQKRFLQSIWALYLDEAHREIDLEELKENLNY